MRRVCGLLLILGMIFCLAACEKRVEERWQEQYDLGVRYLSEGNYEQAIIAFTAAIEIDPKRPEAFIGRGDAYIASEETDTNLAAARTDYETALTLDKTLVDAWLALSNVYVRQGDYDKAIEVLQQGLEETGSSELAQRQEELSSQVTTAAPGSGLEAWYNSRQDIETEVWALSSATLYIPDGRWVQTFSYSYDAWGRLVREDRELSSEIGTKSRVAVIWGEDPETGTWVSKSLWRYSDGSEEEELDSSDDTVQVAGEGPFEHLSSASLHAWFPELPIGSIGTFYFNAYPNAEATLSYTQALQTDLPGAEVRYSFDETGNVSRADLYDGTGELHSYVELTFAMVPVLQ